MNGGGIALVGFSTSNQKRLRKYLEIFKSGTDSSAKIQCECRELSQDLRPSALTKRIPKKYQKYFLEIHSEGLK